MVIFLNAGVLHAELTKQTNHLGHLPRFVAVIGDYSEAKIVITSAQRSAYALDRLREQLPEELRHRVIGMTAENNHDERPGSRQWEVLLWLDGYDPDTQWVSLDDHAPGYSSPRRLVLCRNGFKQQEETELRARLTEIRQFGRWQDYRDRCIAFFGAADKALRWLSKPKVQFGGLSPRDMFDAGRLNELNDLLTRAEHGIW